MRPSGDAGEDLQSAGDTYGRLLLDAGAQLSYDSEKMGYVTNIIAASFLLACPEALSPQPEPEEEILPPVSDWCERGDSNPHGFTRQILSLVRLPIPPLSQRLDSTSYELRCLQPTRL